MKKVSQKDLKKLIKHEGWELTPESKKDTLDRNRASTLTKQVEAITSLAESVDGIKDTLRANTRGDYMPILNALVKSIQNLKFEPTSINDEPKGYNFIIKRGSDGLITEIEAAIK